MQKQMMVYYSQITCLINVGLFMFKIFPMSLIFREGYGGGVGGEWEGMG